MSKSDNPGAALPQVSDLRALLALAADGTVSQAARRLGMTQSGLSYALERMRERFGDPLFVRVGNRMAPTPLAIELQEPAARVLRILETEIAEVRRFDPLTTQREFRVAVNEIGAMTLVPRLVKRLSSTAPGARLSPVNLASSALLAALVSGDVDIAAGHFPDMGDTLLQQLLFHRDYVCVARAGHAFIGEALSLAEFAAAPQVCTPGIPATMAWLASQLRRKGLRMNTAMVCHHVAAIPFIVSSSDLIAIVPAELLDLFGPITRLKAVRLPLIIPAIDIRQYWHPRLAADPAIGFLREQIFQLDHRGAAGAPM